MDPPVVMTPRKRGHKWEITYRIPGYTKTFSERFETEEEAILRCAEIAVAKKEGTLTPPVKGRKVKPITVSQLMDEFVYTYGTSHWGESYLSLAKHRVEHYIKPYLGYYLVKHITPALLEQYYSDLLTRPAVHMKGHRHTSTVSFDVMEKCHSLIRSSLNMAVRWGYINHNPAEYVILPNRPMSRPREVWDPETARRALDCCEDPVLRLCILLSIACSLRIGEILGLQWKNVHLYENKLSYLEVRQELKRCNKQSLAELKAQNRSDVFFEFDLNNPTAESVLVLKKPKTETSIRRVYLSSTASRALREIRHLQQILKEDAAVYYDYDLVIAHPDGRPVELRSIDKAFKKLIQKHHFPMVVFHSLRHLSASLKLQFSGGDIKAVQGDMGHAQSRMVTQVYSHTFDEDRQHLATLIDKGFFHVEETDSEKMDLVLKHLKQNPKLLDLLLAMSD